MKQLPKLLSVLIAFYLVRRVATASGADLKLEFRQCDPSSLTLAFFSFGVGIALSSYRWTKLLEVQQVVLTTWQAIRLTMIGVFFNVVVPGGVGGDVIKMIYIRRQAGERTPEAILSILVDRILGLLGLFIVAILAVFVNWQFLTTAPAEVRVTVTTVFAISVLGFLGVAGAMYHDLFLGFGPFRGLLDFCKARLPRKLTHLVGRVVHALVLYRYHPRRVLQALWISFWVHSFTAMSVWGIGQSFHAEILTLPQYFLATQIANTVSAVPITPGGLGGRDTILHMFFVAFGEEPHKASVIPVVLSMMLVLWSLIGGVFYFLESRFEAIDLKSRKAA